MTVRTPLMEALAAAEAFALAFVFFAVLESVFGFAAVSDVSLMLQEIFSLIESFATVKIIDTRFLADEVFVSSHK